MNSPKYQSGGIALWLLVVLFLVGAASLVYGLSDAEKRPDFALLAVTYLFLLGISQAGVVFTAMLRLVKADWGKPWYRLAELSTLAYFPFAIAGFLLIVYYGRDDLFYWLQASPEDHLSPWLDFDWLMLRSLGGLLLFYGLAAIYVRKSLRPDLASGNEASSIDHDEVERHLYVLSPLVLLGFVVCNTFIAWDFAMMLIPHWHSTVFPIHYWFGNIFAGSAAVIAIAVVMRRIDGGRHFGPTQIRSLGMLITGFTLMWLYFFWAQFFVVWFGNLPHEFEPLWRQMYGHYSPYFWSMLAGCFFVPFVAFLFAFVKRSVFAMCVIALAINAGIWLNKYLMIVPVFSPDDRPFDHWIDIMLALGLLAGFLAVIAMLSRRLPVYSTWEMSRES
ncbi:MAG: NrfD/PsrC family molybdoenzyme membrane anchor subunit [Woeseia sp.]